MFCSTAKGSLWGLLYPESFMLCKKEVNDDFTLDLYIPIDFQPRIKSVTLSLVDSNESSVG